MGDSDKVPGTEPLERPEPLEPPARLGETLRAARLAQDLTLEQVATELRIEAKQLLALEENRFEQIGVPVFVKGYLKQYAQRVGVNVPELMARYREQTNVADVQIQPSRTIKLHDERQITAWGVAVIVLVAVIVGLAVYVWNEGAFDPTRFLPSAAPPGTQSSSAGLPSRPASEPATRLAPPAVAGPAPAPADSQARGVSPAPAAGAPPATGESAAAVAGASSIEGAASAAAPITIPLVFSFAQESWAEVTDARGERLLFGLNAAGRSVTVRGEPPFALVLGNADAVTLVVNGQPYAIPTTGRQNNLARFSVDIAEE